MNSEYEENETIGMKVSQKEFQHKQEQVQEEKSQWIWRKVIWNCYLRIKKNEEKWPEPKEL